jgi:hypothetical protein
MSEGPQQVPPWWTDPTVNVQSLVDAAMQRQDDLRVQESQHVRELMELRATYEDRLREQESERIDAIRAADVGAVQRTAEVASTRAEVLAAQVIATAEASRQQLATALEPIQKDIRDLRDAQARTVGVREQVVDQRDTGSATRLNINVAIAVIGIIVAVVSLAVVLSR